VLRGLPRRPLALRRYPGLRRALLAMHPAPAEDACDPLRESCLRHRLVCLSRACSMRRTPTAIRRCWSFAGASLALLRQGESSSREMATLGAAVGRTYAAPRAISRPKCALRTRWCTIATTIATCGPSSRRATRRSNSKTSSQTARSTIQRCRRAITPNGMRLCATTGPTGSACTTHLQPAGDPADIDALLGRHAPVAKHLKRVLD
jgi:nitric oxide reductase NorD protein